MGILKKYLWLVLFFIASGISVVNANEAKNDKEKFSEIQKAYIDCSLINLSAENNEEINLQYRIQYECYKKVVFQLIDAFQPKVADEVKMSFMQYLDAYEKMAYNQYLSLEPCSGSCGNIIEDYISINRTNMMESIVRGYILAVKGYI